ncbi:MAG: 2-oxoacid:acceptor oxidoreductase family protein [candidate division Zixibacteria bacterium]|nr:2-oxoacid:acceptor oxidoreductase family protein [candidate division Zixibacteria bacterium]MDH3937051.1 2-oxoacid:acceptor oxidoreductase family protein [candidate division Zixibacteria bacterium]MDH4034670.1 2-oxoacid:acceptor oxidoreductase family protein [candidate division Zixibacteria bacterium]
MKEITFFGRGGQGAVVASEILTDAYFRQGYHVQSFPSFGVERRGAPVTAFLRTDKQFIHLRSQIYQADAGLVFASNIVGSPTFRPSVKPQALLVINAPTLPENLNGFDVSIIDASSIALKCGLGSAAQPLVNTAMLGAFAKAAGNLKLKHLLASVESKVPQKTEANLQAVKLAYGSVVHCE